MCSKIASLQLRIATARTFIYLFIFFNFFLFCYLVEFMAYPNSLIRRLCQSPISMLFDIEVADKLYNP